MGCFRRLITSAALLPLLWFSCVAVGQEYNAGFRRSRPMTSVLWHFNLNDLADGVTEYFPVMSNSSGGGEATEADATGVATFAGTIKNLRILLHADIGPANDDAAFTLMVGGAASTLTCTISGGAGSETSCTDVTNRVTIAVGDTLSWRVVTTNTPAGQTYLTAEYDTTENDGLFAGNCNPTTDAVHYAPLHGHRDICETTDLDQVETHIPTAGTIDDLYIDMATAPGAGTNWAFAVMVNGAAGNPTCTVSNTDTTCNNSTSVSISAGDEIVLRMTPTGAVANNHISYGVKFTADDTGEFVIAGSSGDTTHATSTEYQTPNNSGDTRNWNTEAARDPAFTTTMTIVDFGAQMDTDPGAGNTYDWDITDDSTNTLPACQMSSGDTDCLTSGNSVSVAADSLLSIELVPASTPSTSDGTAWGLSATFP